MSTDAPATPPERLVSLDAYRGFTMLAMASEGLGLAQVARRFPDHPTWQLVGYHFDHVAWLGCAAWDLIQPSFTFMVGVSLAFSCASRVAKGQSYGRMALHALWRSLLLVALGVLLRSRNVDFTNFTFEDTLTQIGLGYFFLFLLWGRPAWLQWLAAIGILVGYWCYFYFYPLPPEGFDFASVGVPADWQHLTGNAAHWDKNTNAAAGFDQWFLNLFPRGKEFVFNGGGYLTLSFIPTLATMIFGLLAGELLRSTKRDRGFKFAVLVAAGVIGLAIGHLLEVGDICPIVKRIWTPSWTIYSAGWAALILAGFHGVVDLLGLRRWTFPLVVVGMNSIAMYCMAELIPGWLASRLQAHLGPDIFAMFGADYEPLVRHGAILLVLWLICYWLYRQKVFIRI